MRFRRCFVLFLTLPLLAPAVSAAPVPTEDAEVLPVTDGAPLDALADEIQAQRAATAALEQALDAQQAALDEQRLLIASQKRQIEALEVLLQSTNAQVSQLEETRDTSLQDGDVLLSERLERLEQQLQEAPEDPMAAQEETFPGS